MSDADRNAPELAGLDNLQGTGGPGQPGPQARERRERRLGVKCRLLLALLALERTGEPHPGIPALCRVVNDPELVYKGARRHREIPGRPGLPPCCRHVGISLAALQKRKQILPHKQGLTRQGFRSAYRIASKIRTCG